MKGAPIDINDNSKVRSGGAILHGSDGRDLLFVVENLILAPWWTPTKGGGGSDPARRGRRIVSTMDGRLPGH